MAHPPLTAWVNRIISTRSTTGESYFGNLDGLRAIAAVFVLISHIPVYSNNLGRPGVLVFFTLSGFLLYQGLLITIDKHGLGSRQILSYLARRVFRIVPLYLAFIAFYAFVDRGWTDQHRLDWFLGHAFFIATGDIHLWTLKTEMVFYVLLPFLVILLVPVRSIRLRLALFAVLIVVSWYFLEHLRLQHQTGVTFMITGFLVGMAAVHVYKKIPPGLAKVLGAVSMAWIVLISVFNDFTKPLTDFLGLADPISINSRQYFLYPACFLLVACLCRFQSRLWGNRWLRLTGVCGYGFYLWHVWSTELLIRHMELGYLFQLIAIALTLVLAVVSYLLIEQPGIRAGKRVAAWLMESGPLAGSIKPLHVGLLVLAVLLGVRQYYYFSPKYHFQLDLWASKQNFVQLYLRDGCCFSKQNSRLSQVPAEQWQRVYMPLKEVDLTGIRIDPGGPGVKFRFQSIAVQYPFRQVEELDLAAFEANHDVRRLEIVDGVLEVDVEEEGVDPILLYKGSINKFPLRTATMAALYAAALFFVLLLVSALVDRTFRPRTAGKTRTAPAG